MKVTYYTLLLEAFSACICHVRSENFSIYTFFAAEGLSFRLSRCKKTEYLSTHFHEVLLTYGNTVCRYILIFAKIGPIEHTVVPLLLDQCRRTSLNLFQ
jgi:hypothetical protein